MKFSKMKTKEHFTTCMEKKDSRTKFTLKAMQMYSEHFSWQALIWKKTQMMGVKIQKKSQMKLRYWIQTFSLVMM
jgi:RNase P protein component